MTTRLICVILGFVLGYAIGCAVTYVVYCIVQKK